MTGIWRPVSGSVTVLADQVRVALVLRMHHHGDVAEHGFRTRGRHHQFAAAVAQRVADRPQEAVFLFVDDFQVGDRGLQHRVPVDQALATVDQAVFVQAHERLDHRVGGHRVHGEHAARPVARRADAAHLALDDVAGLLLPLPHLGDETLAAERVARLALAFGGEVARDDHFRGDARVVGAHLPQRVEAAHAVVAHQRVHQRVLERMAHVQRAGDVRRRQQDRVRLALAAGLEHAAALPLFVQAGFELLGVVGGGEGVGHGGPGLVLVRHPGESRIHFDFVAVIGSNSKMDSCFRRNDGIGVTCRTSSTPARAPGTASSVRAAGRARNRPRERPPARVRNRRRRVRRAG